MRAELVTETRVYIKCPKCGGDKSMRVDHILSRSSMFGPWYCDACGEGIVGEVLKSGEVEISDSPKTAGKRWDKSLVLLELRPRPVSVYVIIRGGMFDGEKDNHDYFYEEHDCPTNFLSQIEMMIVGDSVDPHGAFDYVAEIKEQEIDNLSANEVLAKFKKA